ncbi:hypothetical protein HY639_04895, partial [Candidatus Woesearchaeota archaeon]|nr:hypothetical protein [Candidatus Woesearchaeota archaeon]
EAVTYFLFRQQAKPYGEFIAEQGIVKLRQYVCDETYAKGQESFGRGLWVGDLCDGSDLLGYGYLYGGRVRGVRREVSTKHLDDTVLEASKKH